METESKSHHRGKSLLFTCAVHAQLAHTLTPWCRGLLSVPESRGERDFAVRAHVLPVFPEFPFEFPFENMFHLFLPLLTLVLYCVCLLYLESTFY